jgi:pantothenate kinase type III
LSITFICGDRTNKHSDQLPQTFLEVSAGAFGEPEPISILSPQLPETLAEVCVQFFENQNQFVTTSAYEESC